MNSSELFAGSNASVNVSLFEQDPEYYSYRYRTVGTFFQGVVFLVGVVSNLMVVVVVKKTQSLHSPLNYYLVNLAAADSVTLLSTVPKEILSYYLLANQWVLSDMGCRGYVFSQNLGITLSSFTLAAVALECYVTSCHPVVAQRVCTVPRTKSFIAGVWFISVVYCSPWLGLSTTRMLRYKGHRDIVCCDLKLSRPQYLIYFFSDLLVVYVVPVVFSCILYGLIARATFSRKSTTTETTSNGVLHHQASSHADRWKIVRMLVVLVAVHTILWLPYRGMFLYNNFAAVFNMDKFSDLWFIMFAKTCIFINSAVKLFLYNAMYEEFQYALKNLLVCQRTPSTDTNSATASSTRNLSQKPTLQDPERLCPPYHDNKYHMYDQNPQVNTCGSAEVDLIRNTLCPHDTDYETDG